jgi:hypothetical protein
MPLESRFRSLEGAPLAPTDYARATLLSPDGKVIRHDKGLEYVLTGSGTVALRDAPFAARHPSLARLFRGAGSLGMSLAALNPSLALAAPQYTPKSESDVVIVEAEQAGAVSQHRVRRHLGRAAPTPQLAYIVPISDQTELGIANLDTADAQVAVYSSAQPKLLNDDTWAQVYVSPGLVLDNAVPVRITVPAGGFAWVTPQPGQFAALKVGGARPALVHVIAEHTQTVNGHVLTETIPTTSLDDMIPAGGDGFLPSPRNPTYINITPGVLQGFEIVAGSQPAAVDVGVRDPGGGNPQVLLHYDIDAWGSVRASDVWRAYKRGGPNGNVYTIDVLPRSGSVLAFNLLTDTVGGKQATFLAGQNRGETDFAFVAQRLPGVLLTEPHMIATPADGTSKEILWPLFQPRDSTSPPLAPNPTQWGWIGPFGHAFWDDVIAGSFGFFPGATPNETYGFITGHGVVYYEGNWYGDGPRAALLVWNHLRKLAPYGDVGQWMAVLRPGDECGGEAATPCSIIGVTPNTRFLVANAGPGALALGLDFYDAAGALRITEKENLAQDQNTALDGLVPSGAVRLVSRNASGNKGSYYLIAQTPTGDCDDYQAAKQVPGS